MSAMTESRTAHVSDNLDYQTAKKRICIRAVNYGHNRSLLRNLPYVVEEDLAIVFYYQPEDGEAPQLITAEDLMNWDIDAACLYRDGVMSSGEVHPAFLVPMRRLLGLPGDQMDGEIPMYVLSARDAHYGASVMFYPGVLHRISMGLQDDLYIIPSSIHELILMRAQDVDEPWSLVPMIREINRTEVLPGEVLSDSLYFYNGASDVLRRVPPEGPFLM